MKSIATESSRQSNSRIIGMDYLRVLAALLGIVLHSALPYADIHHNFPWPDLSQQHSMILDTLVGVIHMFRMPVFFLLAGFFAYVIWHKSKEFGFVLNRAKRILLPFLVCWLGPSIFYLAMSLVINLVAHHKISISQFFSHQQYTYGYWFLYYLLLMYTLTLIVLWCKKLITSKLKLSLGRFFSSSKKLNVGAFIILVVIALFLQVLSISAWYTPTPFRIETNIPILFSYTLFYLVGWQLASNREVLDKIQHYSRALLIAGLLVFFPVFCFLYINYFHSILIKHVGVSLFYLSGWFTTLGLVGWFVKSCHKKSKLINYLADASYWIYLVQIPIILMLQGMLQYADLSIYSKFLLVSGITFLICIAGYQLFVRKRKWMAYIDGHARTKKVTTKFQGAMPNSESL